MAYKIPWSNFHELNLDWLLEQVKKLREDVDNITASATPSTTTPLMDGVAAIGTEDNFARGDHVHPTDTSRAAQNDLTQEITDRGNADLALASDIADVDAKIKFSSAAPLMDSSSASSGFSDYMARADHVHPTDTSRASATDLATLTVRVDNIAGAASPYDVTPLMDGVGSAGTVGAYSRGDHKHPSDTSKLDKAGDTMTGYMLETEREQHILGANSIGWVRVATVPQNPGTLCEFRIVREGALTPAETHKITLAVTQSGVDFTDEVSASDVLYVTKIRYSNAGAVDIYLDQNYTSDIGIFLDRYASTEAKSKAVKLITPTGVSASPVGETIITTYDFGATTPQAASGYSMLPDGTLLQWGIDGSYDAATTKNTNITFQKPFINMNYQIIAVTNLGGSDYQNYDGIVYTVHPATTSSATIHQRVVATGAGGDLVRNFSWIAIGRWR